MKKLILMLFALTATTAFGQEDVSSFIELLRSEIRTNKMAIVKEAMELNEAQAEKFWPIFRSYEHELDELGDARLAMIKEYADNYKNMNDEKATELMDKAFDFQSDRLDLRRKYFKQISEALSPTMAAKFSQVDNQILMLIDLQIASELPLIEKPESTKK